MMGRLDPLGIVGLLIAGVILGLFKLFRVKHEIGLIEMAGFVVVGIVQVAVLAVPLLAAARYFEVWPFAHCAIGDPAEACVDF